MEDSEVLDFEAEKENLCKVLNKAFKDIIYEIKSRTGLIKYKSVLGHSSIFEAILEVIIHSEIQLLCEIIRDNNLSKIEEYKNNLINKFMIMHYKCIHNKIKEKTYIE